MPKPTDKIRYTASAAGKGYMRRPSQVSSRVFEENWDAIFKKEAVAGGRISCAAPNKAAEPQRPLCPSCGGIGVQWVGHTERPEQCEDCRGSGNAPSPLDAFERWWNNPVNQPQNPKALDSRMTAIEFLSLRAATKTWMRRAFRAGVMIGRQLPKPSVLRRQK